MVEKSNCRQCGKEIDWYRGRPRIVCSKECEDKRRSVRNKKNWLKNKPKTLSKCKTCGVIIPSSKVRCGPQCYERQSKWQAVNRYKKHLENSRQLLNRANSIVFVND